MKKGRVINFEWMCDQNHYTLEQFDAIKTKLIKQEISQAADDGCNVIIGIYLMDGFLQPSVRYTEFVDHLTEIKLFAENLDIKEIYLVSGQGEELEGLPFNHFFYDYNVRMTINSYKNDLLNLPKYTPSNEKFLFLTGMPNRANRIGLMGKFYDNNLLQNADWSFFSPWTTEDKKWCRNCMSHYSDKQYEKFLNDCERAFDSRYETAKPYYGSYTSDDADVVWHDVKDTDWIKAPSHIDSRVYTNTVFSVISEGPNYWGLNNFFATEKSWRTFLHRHPFIFAGEPDQFRYLKQLGYKTFEEYLLIKDYAYIKDEDQRLDAVVENTKYWLANKDKYLEEISKDVEHNYNMFFYHIKKQDDLCEYFVNTLGVPRSDIDFYFDKVGYDHLIRRIPDGI
jgi:hypothetical protein